MSQSIFSVVNNQSFRLPKHTYLGVMTSLLAARNNLAYLSFKM